LVLGLARFSIGCECGEAIVQYHFAKGWQDCEAASNLHPIWLCPEGRQKPRITSREHQSGIALEDQDKRGQQHHAGRLSVQMTKVCFLSSLAYLVFVIA